MYKMITFDIDGTLVQHLTHELSFEIKDMFRRLKEKGYIVTLATGRDFVSIGQIYKNEYIDYFIGANGSFIYDLKNNKYLFNSSIDFYEFKEINDSVFMKNLDFLRTIIVSNPNNVFVLNNKKKTNSWFWDEFVDKFEEYDLIESKLNREYFHLLTIEHDRESNILNDINNFCKENNTSLSVQAHWPTGLFMANKNINKSSSIKKLCEILGISMKEVIAFGDGENDIEMIRDAGLGVAMDNAVDQLKEIADEITVDVEDFGTKVFLEKIGII